MLANTVSDSIVSFRNGRYISYANGVVFDNITDLEWYAGAYKEQIGTRQENGLKNLSVAGGGWQMPTINELKTLYQKGAGTHNMTPLLNTTGWWV